MSERCPNCNKHIFMPMKYAIKYGNYYIHSLSGIYVWSEREYAQSIADSLPLNNLEVVHAPADLSNPDALTNPPCSNNSNDGTL